MGYMMTTTSTSAETFLKVTRCNLISSWPSGVSIPEILLKFTSFSSRNVNFVEIKGKGLHFVVGVCFSQLLIPRNSTLFDWKSVCYVIGI